MNRFFTRLGINLIKVVSLLPFSIIYALSDILYIVLYYLVGYRKKVVQENLRFAFPEKDEKTLKDIEKRFYRHFADFMLETVKIHNMDVKTLEKRWKIENPELLNKFYDENISVSLLTMHYNNWEWSNYIALYIKHYPMAVYRPLHNKGFDEFINKTRTKFGVNMIPDKNTLRAIIKIHTTGEPLIVWLAADQTPPGSYKNWYRFLHRDTIFYTGATQISKKFEHAILFQRIKKVRRGFYSTRFEVLTETPSNYSDDEIMRMYIDRMEAIIKSDPEYYLWSHRRWKHKRSKE